MIEFGNKNSFFLKNKDLKARITANLRKLLIAKIGKAKIQFKFVNQLMKKNNNLFNKKKIKA